MVKVGKNTADSLVVRSNESDDGDAAGVEIVFLTPRDESLVAPNRIDLDNPAVIKVLGRRINCVRIANNDLAIFIDGDADWPNQVSAGGEHRLSSGVHGNMYYCADAEVPVSRGHIRQIDVFAVNRNGLREFQAASLGNERLVAGSRINSDYLTGKPDVDDNQIAVLGHGDAHRVTASSAEVAAFRDDCLFSRQRVQPNDGFAIRNENVSFPLHGNAEGNAKQDAAGDDGLGTGQGIDPNDGQ